MTKPDRKSIPNQEEMAEIIPLKERLKAELFSCLLSMGMESLHELLEDERTAVCGAKHARDPERDAYRAGHTQGELVMGGRRVQVRRPRARTTDGQEVHLPSWVGFSNEDPLHERAVEQMVVGVSTRKYARSLEHAACLKTRGTSKSAVSRRFVALSQKRFAEWMARDLSGLDLVTVMIDGLHFEEHIVLVALGFDIHGEKHILGLWEGATENGAACRGLLDNLEGRGLDAERPRLFVIDGSKALRSAIEKKFGGFAVVQRCRVHKMRNVLDHLTVSAQPSVKKAMQDAYARKDAEAAEKALRRLSKTLASNHPGASASLLEGLEETLSVKRLGIGGELERIFSTTNAIENVNGTARQISGRVKRWRGGQMILRWICAGMEEAQKKFRRIRGYRKMPVLKTALERTSKTKTCVDTSKNAA